ncbi:MAG: hypothetical protein ACXWL5_00890 [Candidatus Chromulinivorax sp.]
MNKSAIFFIFYAIIFFQIESSSSNDSIKELLEVAAYLETNQNTPKNPLKRPLSPEPDSNLESDLNKKAKPTKFDNNNETLLLLLKQTQKITEHTKRVTEQIKTTTEGTNELIKKFNQQIPIIGNLKKKIKQQEEEIESLKKRVDEFYSLLKK